MSKISKSDLLIILESAIQMALKDSTLVSQEKGLIKKIMGSGHITTADIKNHEQAKGVNIKSLCHQLSSTKSKKLMLLTMAAIAMVDNNLDADEIEMIHQVSKELNVGQIKLDPTHYQEYEELILKMISEMDSF
jgi:hypothetical protein